MKSFRIALKNKIEKSIYNNYGADNYDKHRFGNFEQQRNRIEELKNRLKKSISYKVTERGLYELQKIEKYEKQLEFLWSKINDEGKNLLVHIIAFRILGYTKIKMPFDKKFYLESLDKVKNLQVGKDFIDPKFMHFILHRYNLHPIGPKVELYFSDVGIVIDFILEQYAYKLNGNYLVHAEKGDVVLDMGACWGDTALYFADKVGEQGKVYSFEFIPNNIKIFKINTGLNNHIDNVIELVEHPVSDKSGTKIYFKDHGPGSKISYSPFAEHTGVTETVSVDDFVEQSKLTRVDFLKMDIEGAEPAALRGAINTIKKFKPKLAIAIYHSMEDFVNIPKWIVDLNLGYKLFLGHFTIHSEETVIYAIADQND